MTVVDDTWPKQSDMQVSKVLLPRMGCFLRQEVAGKHGHLMLPAIKKIADSSKLFSNVPKPCLEFVALKSAV